MTPTHQTTGPDAVNADLDTVTHAASTPCLLYTSDAADE